MWALGALVIPGAIQCTIRVQRLVECVRSRAY